MKLKHLAPSLIADFTAILEHYKICPLTMNGDKPGDLRVYWQLLNVVSRNRAYDDTHPGFASGEWARVLPFDGRDYCWYYDGGANDDHVKTLLKFIKSHFEKPVQLAIA
jgi:hypothetical protein